MTPDITPLPIAPQRTDLPATFSQRADSFVAALQPFRDELVSAIDWQNTTFIATESARDAAANSASAASTSANNASNSASAAATSEEQAGVYAGAAQAAAGVPSLTGNADKVLQVNSAGDGVLWGTSLPEIGRIVSTENMLSAPYLQTNNLYLQNSYPTLFSLTGLYATLDSVVSGTPSPPNLGLGVYADADYVYLAHDSSPYFTVVRKSDWSVVSGTPTLPNTGRGVYADNDYVYLAHDGSPYFTVVRKSDWGIEVGISSIPNLGFGVYADADYVYLTHSSSPNFTVIEKYNYDTTSLFLIPRYSRDNANEYIVGD